MQDRRFEKGVKELSIEKDICLECPYCDEAIHRSLSWFKQTYFTCPACEQGLSAAQFAGIVDEIEEELDAQIEEMIQGSGEKKSGCCGGRSSCCK
jgi:peptide subunit release factor 1 (eRF1)